MYSDKINLPIDVQVKYDMIAPVAQRIGGLQDEPPSAAYAIIHGVFLPECTINIIPLLTKKQFDYIQLHCDEIAEEHFYSESGLSV